MQDVRLSWPRGLMISTGSSVHVKNHKITGGFAKSTRFANFILNYENGPPRGNLGNIRGKIMRLLYVVLGKKASKTKNSEENRDLQVATLGRIHTGSRAGSRGQPHLLTIGILHKCRLDKDV